MDGLASKAPSKKRKALASKVLTRQVKRKSETSADVSGVTVDVATDGASIDLEHAAGVLADAMQVADLF